MDSLFKKLIAVIALLALVGTPKPAQAEAVATPGPIFTLPKTLVQVDFALEKSVLSPGTYCEFIDLFLPGMEPDVACNSKLLPPTNAEADDKCEISTLVNYSQENVAGQLAKAKKDTNEAAKSKGSELKRARVTLAAAQKQNAERATLQLKRSTLTEQIHATEGKKNDLGTNLAKTDKKNKQQYDKEFAKKAAKEYNGLDAARKAWAEELKQAETEIGVAQKELLALPATPDAVDTAPIQTQVSGLTTEFDRLQAVASEHSQQPPKPAFRTAIKSYAVSTSGVPDPRYTGALTAKSGFFIDATQSLELSPSGIITGIEAEIANRKAEFFMSLLKAAAGIFGRVMTGAGLAAMDVPSTDPQLRKTDIEAFEKEFILEGKPEGQAAAENLVILNNFRMLSLCRMKQYALAWKHKDAFRAAVNHLQLARRSYQSISGYSGAIGTILTSGPGPGVQVVLDAATKRLKDALSTDFLGSKATVSWSPAYQSLPQASDASATSRIFQIASCGVKIPEGAMKPVKNALPSAFRCAPVKQGDPEPEFSDVAFTIARKAGGLADEARKKYSEFTKDGKGLPFIIPGKATVSVSNSGIDLVDPEVDVAQWGFATRLPDGLLTDDNGGIKVTYYEATGALKSIKVVSKARLNSGMVDSVGGSVMTALDAKLKADAEEAKKAKADADELLQLQRQRQILEEKEKIKKACENLKIPCEN